MLSVCMQEPCITAIRKQFPSTVAQQQGEMCSHAIHLCAAQTFLLCSWGALLYCRGGSSWEGLRIVSFRSAHWLMGMAAAALDVPTDAIERSWSRGGSSLLRGLTANENQSIDSIIVTDEITLL